MRAFFGRILFHPSAGRPARVCGREIKQSPEKAREKMGKAKKIENETSDIINAWSTLAPTASFGGMTLAQYKAKVQPTFDTRSAIAVIEAQRTSALDARDDADAATVPVNLLVVNAVKGDPAHGEDSDLYEAMGYVRKSARKSGLTRKAIALAAAAKK
jgi:hypothetical protein